MLIIKSALTPADVVLDPADSAGDFMIKDPKDGAPTHADVVADAVSDASELAVLRALVADLEREKVTLTQGLASRQHIGFITGVLGQRYGLQPEPAWRLLAHVSQELNVKATRVADILLAVYAGELASQDVQLAVRISALLPPGPVARSGDASSVAGDAER